MRLAFVFPGQGAQAVGMLDSLADRPEVADLMRTADTALDEPISELIRTGPSEALALTVNTQPAMLLAGLACYRAWRASGGPDAQVMAGHSLGEYTALTAAGAFDPAEALALVRIRARAMQDAVPVGTGTMAAILGLDDDAVMRACREAAAALAQAGGAEGATVVEAANFNAPSQVVIAGNTAAVEKACEIARALGAKRAMTLPVSAPFHSSLLRPAGEVLRQALTRYRVQAPRVPILNNVDVALTRDPAVIVDALIRQASSPVRWVECIRALEASGIERIIEFGPGKVLAGLIKRISPAIPVATVTDAASLEAVLKECA